MNELFATLVTAAGFAAIGHTWGTITAGRRHRRQHAATAQCTACNWESDPVPLADAFTAASVHSATPTANGAERHRGFVVKA